MYENVGGEFVSETPKLWKEKAGKRCSEKTTLAITCVSLRNSSGGSQEKGSNKVMS